MLSSLKTAATIDPDRLEEVAMATRATFDTLGMNRDQHRWAVGPLMEAAATLATHQDAVDELLPDLAAWVRDHAMVGPKQWGLTGDPEDSLLVSAVTVASRIDALVRQEDFGMGQGSASAFALDLIMSGARYLYEQMLHGEDPLGADRQRLVQAAIREAMKCLDPVWQAGIRELEERRLSLPLPVLREWLAVHPQGVLIDHLNTRYGAQVDRLLDNLDMVRTRVAQMQADLQVGKAPILSEADIQTKDRTAHPVEPIAAEYRTAEPSMLASPAALAVEPIATMAQRALRRPT